MKLAYWKLEPPGRGQTTCRLISLDRENLAFVAQRRIGYSVHIPRAWIDEWQMDQMDQFATMKDACDAIELFWIAKGFRILTEKEMALR